MNIQKVGSGDVRNDEAVLNKSGGLCAGTAHDVGDPLFVYKLGLAEEKLHPGDRAMLDRLGVMYTYTETDHDVGNPVYVYKLGMAGQHDVGDPECEYKLGMAKQTLHPDVKHLGDINKVSSLIVNDNFCVVRVAGVSDEGGADGI